MSTLKRFIFFLVDAFVFLLFSFCVLSLVIRFTGV